MTGCCGAGMANFFAPTAISAYHRHMRGEDPASRFDYLFEPIGEVDVDVDSGGGEGVDESAIDRERWTAVSKLALALFIAAAAAMTFGVFILLMRPESPRQTDAPVQPAS